MKEKVLVFPTYRLENIGMFQGFSPSGEVYADMIFDHSTYFMDRESAETDVDYKQIIPYTFISSKGRIFSYVRGKSGGEQRLKKKQSIGIGGHVNDGDAKPGDDEGDYYAVIAGAIRERCEEVYAWCYNYTYALVGAINDDSNEVGKVHFGLVYRWDISDSFVQPRDPAITEPEFITLAEALEPSRFAEYEPWSQYVLEAIRDGKIDIGSAY